MDARCSATSPPPPQQYDPNSPTRNAIIDGYGHILGMLSVWLNGSEEEGEVGLPLQGGKWDGG